MIVKEAPIRRARRSSFVQLTNYITEGFAETGIRTDAARWDDLIQYIVAPSAIDWTGSRVDKTIAVEAGGVLSLATAAYEMHAVAARNPRAFNPVLHLIISWPESERPDTEEIFIAARRVLTTLELLDHQYVVAIHGNTENLHAHIEVNRVHPITFKAARLAWMHKTLHRVAREIEIEHGWSHDNGLYEVVEINGKKTIVESDEKALLDAVSAGASRSETWSGEASLERWCRDAPASALRATLSDQNTSSWRQVHLVLASFGLELRETSYGGMCVHDVGSPEALKRGSGRIASLSDAFNFVKRSQLEDRFGRFAPSEYTPLAARSRVAYKRDPDKRLERRVERKASQNALRERFKSENEEARKLRALAERALKDEFLASDRERMLAQENQYKACRGEIRADKSLTSVQKQQAYMLAKLTHARVRAQLRDQITAEREIRRELLPRLPTWRQWVEKLAQTGHEAAISALRGLIYRERRGAKKYGQWEAPEDANMCAIKPAEAVADDPCVRDLVRLTWKVSSHGLVTYSLNGAAAFVDAGPKVRFDLATVSQEALQLALRYSEQKWGGELRLVGGDQAFRERVAKAARVMGIKLVDAGTPAVPTRGVATKSPTGKARSR